MNMFTTIALWAMVFPFIVAYVFAQHNQYKRDWMWKEEKKNPGCAKSLIRLLRTYHGFGYFAIFGIPLIMLG
jgi:hypothetical protein